MHCPNGCVSMQQLTARTTHPVANQDNSALHSVCVTVVGILAEGCSMLLLQAAAKAGLYAMQT